MLKKKRQIITSVGEDGEKVETSYIPGRNVNWYNYFGKYSGNSSKC